MNKKKVQKTTEELLEEISVKLDRLFYAFILPSLEGKEQQDQIDVLSKYQLSNKEIAGIVGANADTVRATISKLKRNK